LLLTACNGNSASNTNSETDSSEAKTPADKNSYHILFKPEDSVIEAGKEATLSFTPKIKEKENQQVPLEESHGKKINLMVVNDDLSFFNQLWPAYNTDGSYSAKQKFPTGGKYHLILIYKPGGGEKKTENILVNVTGKPVAEKNYNANKFTASTDNYTVILTPNMPVLKTNELLHFDGLVKQNGKEIDANELDTYLEGKANLVLLKMDDKSYEHSHSDAQKGHFDFHHTFKQPGIYRGWLQFQNQGKVFTTDFTFDVK
jgi:hypothetical protein